jgi:protein-S-isoprenylcysteine O-methyltransferase Ste14
MLKRAIPGATLWAADDHPAAFGQRIESPPRSWRSVKLGSGTHLPYLPPMTSVPAVLGAVYLTSELFLRFWKHSQGGNRDAGSLRLIWLVISLSTAGAWLIAANTKFASFRLTATGWHAAELLFLAGLGLRWWSIGVLGKRFTVEVTILPDHELVTNGPYRFVRHPSYTGMMVAFAALALTFQNWLSCLIMLLPIALVLNFRVKVEEAALVEFFGERYLAYRARVPRLFPFIG